MKFRWISTLVLSILLLGLAPPFIESGATEEPGPPSIVLILTDDQRFDTLWAMPTVQQELVDRGVSFTDAFVANALCCPSRASILTGRYSHSTGVYTNNPPNGGFEAFQPNEGSTIATWLQGAGYRTALIGKYLNHFGAAGRSGYVPPGWNRWVAFAQDNGRYYDYSLDTDGSVQSYGSEPEDYSTDVLAEKAVEFIEDDDDVPLFLYFAPTAPHGPANPAPRHQGAFSGLEPYRPPSYDEEDASDKPAWVQGLPRFTPERSASLDAFRRKQYESLLAVDEAVQRIVEALRDEDRLSNTMIVFTSDNGLAWGEHRWRGKQNAYEESIRVPMVVRYDPLVASARSEVRPVMNIDLAPTFAQLAGVAAPGAEGASLVPLLEGAASSWRTDFLVEHLEDGDAPIPTYCAVRNEQNLYVIYQTGEEELYDLLADPYELDNRASDPAYAPMLTQLRERTKTLCAPPPPGFTFPY